MFTSCRLYQVATNQCHLHNGAISFCVCALFVTSVSGFLLNIGEFRVLDASPDKRNGCHMITLFIALRGRKSARPYCKGRVINHTFNFKLIAPYLIQSWLSSDCRWRWFIILIWYWFIMKSVHFLHWHVPLKPWCATNPKLRVNRKCLGRYIPIYHLTYLFYLPQSSWIFNFIN